MKYEKKKENKGTKCSRTELCCISETNDAVTMTHANNMAALEKKKSLAENRTCGDFVLAKTYHREIIRVNAINVIPNCFFYISTKKQRREEIEYAKCYKNFRHIYFVYFHAKRVSGRHTQYNTLTIGRTFVLLLTMHTKQP